MITKITSISTHSYKLFFRMIRTFMIHSLSNFQIYSTVLLTAVTILNITSPGLIYVIPGSFYFLPPSPFCPPRPIFDEVVQIFDQFQLDC